MTANNNPTSAEKLYFKTVMTNVGSIAPKAESDAFLVAAKSLPVEKMNELYRSVVSVARHGFQSA